jgi:BirA family biotin operon repressor/biotin-[acetyl-CoA-carboxylase] ligase
MTDLLQAADVNSAVHGTIFADKVQIFQTIDSTNTYAMQEAAKGAPHGTVYVAEEQTAGRGRGAHTWHSEPYAGLYISTILRPQMAPADALWLSLATGLAVQSAIENVTALVPDIRWPNDLLFENRKFGGILTEMNAETTRVRYAVAGIGINVNHGQFPPELRDVATSLRLESDRIASRQDLLIAILQAMNSEIEILMRAETFASAIHSILTRLEKKSSWIRGKQVFVDEAGGYTGVTAGLDTRGFLRVETAAGLRTVLSGGVRASRGIDR